MKNNTFTESQSFVSTWFVLLMIFTIALPVLFLFLSEWSDFAEGSLVGVVVATIVLLGVVLGIKLKTRIDDEGVYVDFKPFVRNRKWSWDDIETIQVKRYSIWDYGGWGYRLGKDGMAYTTKGSYGFQVKLKGGKKVLIGTQQPDLVQEVIKNKITDGII